MNCASHHYYSDLGTLGMLHLCAPIPNVRISELDIDDVLWKDEHITHQVEIANGEALIRDRPGWGADLNGEVAFEHAWERSWLELSSVSPARSKEKQFARKFRPPTPRRPEPFATALLSDEPRFDRCSAIPTARR